MKKLLFALVAGVLADGFVWLLQLIGRRIVMGMEPIVGVWVVLLGVPLVVAGFLVGMIRLGKVAQRWGFEGYSPATLFAAGFFCMLIRSFFVGKSTVDVQIHDTYFVFAAGHVEKGIAILSGLFSLVYFYYPKLFRRPLHRRLGYWHFWMTAVGLFLFFNAAVVFMDMMDDFYLRRMKGNGDVFVMWDQMAKVALVLLAPGQLVFLINLVYSGLRRQLVK